MKRLKYILLIFIILFTFNVKAANKYSVSITSKTITVGNTATLTIKSTNCGGRFGINLSNSNVKVSGSDFLNGGVWFEGSGKKSVTIKAVKVGTTKITIDVSKVSDPATAKNVNLSNQSITVTVKEYVPPVPKVKSSNNSLKSLGVSGYKIEPSFSKDVLDYKVTLPVNTEKAKILATLSDSTAKVNGVGDVNVSDGNNNFEITVTAENGSKKVYKLNIYVTPLDPINVNVNDKNLTVIQRSKDMPELNSYFILKDININDKVVPCYYNESLNYNLVGLKDEEGNIEFYKYQDNKYTLYKDYTFNGITVEILDKEIDNYSKTKFNYNDNEIVAYQENNIDLIKNEVKLGDIKESNYYLFYANNLLTGKTNIYQYDKEENTIQIWNQEQASSYQETNKLYYYVILGLIGLVLFIFIILIIVVICKNKKIKKLKQELIIKDEEILFTDLEKSVKKKKTKKSKEEVIE